MVSVIKVERFDVDVGADLSTYTLNNTVSSLNSAFIRLVGPSDKSSGGPTGSTGNANPNVAHCGMQLTGTNEITFYKATSTTVKHMGEVWRYTGNPGGPDEFITRDHIALTISAGNVSNSVAVSGIVDRNKCVPFITGLESNSSSVNDYDSCTVNAYIDASGNLVCERGATTSTITVYVNVVEFTGSNWTVGHGVSTNHDVTDETITLNTDSTGVGGSTFNVTNWSQAFMEINMQGDTDETGLSDCLATVVPGASTSTVEFQIHQDGAARNNGAGYVHVINHPDLVVTRDFNTNITEGNGTYESLAFPSGASTTSPTNELGVEWFCDTNGTGTAHARGRLVAKIADALQFSQNDSIDAAVYDSTQSVVVEIEITFPASPDGVIYEVGGSGTGTAVLFEAGNLIARAGNGGTTPPAADTAYLEITPATYNFANRTGILRLTITNPNTITLEFDENSNGTIDFTDTNTCPTNFTNWSGGDAGGVGFLNSSLAGSYAAGSFNGTIDSLILDQGAGGVISHWVHRSGNNVSAYWGIIELSDVNDPGAAGTDVASDFVNLTLTQYDTTIQANVDTNVTSDFDALALTGYDTTIQANVDTNVTSDFDALALTAYDTTIQANVDTDVTSDFNSLVLTKYDSDVQANVDTNVTSDFDTLTLSAYDSVVQANVDTNVTSDFDALALVQYDTTIQANVDTNITSDFDALALVQYDTTIQANVDTNVTSDFDALALTGYDTTIQANVDTNVTSDFDALALNKYDTNVQANVDTNVTSDFDALALTGYDTTIQANVDTNVTSDFDALVLTPYATLVQAGVNVNIQSDFDALALTGYNTDVQANVDVNVQSDFDAVALTGYDSIVKQLIDVEIVSDIGVLSFNVYQTSIQANVDTNVTSGFDSLALNKYDSNVQANVDLLVTSDFDALTLTGYDADVQANVDINVTSDFDALALTAYDTTIQANVDTNVTSDFDALALVQYDTTIQANVDLLVTSDFDALALNKYDTNVQANVDTNVTSDFDALALTAYETTIQANVDLLVTSDFDSLTLVPYGSAVQAGQDVNIVSSFDVLALSNYNSDVQANVDLLVTSDFDALTLTGYDTNVQANVDVNIQSDFDAVALTGYDSAVQANVDVNIQSDFDAVALTGYDSAVQANVDLSVVSGAATLTLTTYGSSVQAGQDVNIISSFDTLGLTFYESTIKANVDVNIESSFSQITVVAYETQVQANVNLSVTSDFDALALTQYDTTIQANVDQVVTSDFDALALTAFDSFVSVSAGTDVTSDSSLLQFSSFDTVVISAATPNEYIWVANSGSSSIGYTKGSPRQIATQGYIPLADRLPLTITTQGILTGTFVDININLSGDASVETDIESIFGTGTIYVGDRIGAHYGTTLLPIVGGEGVIEEVYDANGTIDTTGAAPFSTVLGGVSLYDYSSYGSKLISSDAAANFDLQTIADGGGLLAGEGIANFDLQALADGGGVFDGGATFVFIPGTGLVPERGGRGVPTTAARRKKQVLIPDIWIWTAPKGSRFAIKMLGSADSEFNPRPQFEFFKTLKDIPVRKEPEPLHFFRSLEQYAKTLPKNRNYVSVPMPSEVSGTADFEFISQQSIIDHQNEIVSLLMHLDESPVVTLTSTNGPNELEQQNNLILDILTSM